ncbi:MAG: ATP-binding protein [Streptosporangiaceae bacterium]
MSGGTGLMIQEHATLNTAMAGTASGNWRLSPDPAPAGWACMPDIALRATGPGSGPVHVARAFTVETLHRWGLTDRCEDIVIVVSEMLTNALRHGRPRRVGTGPGGTRRRAPVRLGLYNPGPWVLCAVADPSRAIPVPRSHSSLDETGRGLQIVSALSDGWGYTTPDETGKVVWAMFARR